MDAWSVDLTLKSVDENQLCGNSSGTLSAVLPLSVIYCAVYAGPNFWVWLKSCGVTIQMKSRQQYFGTCYLFFHVSRHEILDFWQLLGVEGLKQKKQWPTHLFFEMQQQNDNTNNNTDS